MTLVDRYTFGDREHVSLPMADYVALSSDEQQFADRDEDQAAQFFSALYAGQSGMLELRTFGPEDADQSQKAHRQRAAAARLRDFVPVVNGAFDHARITRFLDGCTAANLGAFFGVALRTASAPRDRKGDAAHCETLTALFVDADFKHFGEDETRTRLAALPTPPSIVVNSGGGLHPYLLLQTPINLQTAYEDARRLLRRLAYTVAAIVDMSVSEPARVLRIPGSLNFKYDPPRLVTVERFTGARVDPEDLRLIELISSPSTSDGRSSAPFRMPDTLSGAKKERHETLRLLMRSLQAHGVGTDAAISVCLLENETKCHPPLDEKELKSYLGRAARYADAPDFVRVPKTGSMLCGALVEIGISREAVLVAVRSVTPDFDPNAADDPAWLEVEADAPKMRKARTASKTVSPVIPHGERHDKLFHEGCRQGQTTFVEYTKPESKKGEIIPNHQGNIRLALTRLGLHLSYNAFAAKDLVTYQGLTQLLDDPVVHRAWLSIDEVFHFRPSLNFFEIVVGDLARQQHFHPVREYLDALTWDREPRINTWLATYAGAVDTTTQSEADDSLTYLEAVSSILFIAAVRRIRTPGAKFDELLILESPQGTLKSSALRALCLDDAWFSDDLPLGVDAKQVIERTAGKWIIEATELQGYTNAQVDHLKGMTARQTDGPVRLAYGHRSTEVPRQFVMIGTTNKLTEYLRDSTGNRRFWPVRITRFDVAALTRDRDQLWAEAAYREAAGELIRLPEALWAAAGVEQEARRQVDPWEEVIDQQIDLTDPAVLAVPVEALWAALGDAGKQFKRNDAERLAHILQRNGFTRKKKIDVNYISVKYGVVQIVKAAGRRWVWLREGADPASVEFRREPSV